MSRGVALVTGGSRGIGRAISQELAAKGYLVVVNFRTRADDAKETLEAIERGGGEGMLAEADVSDPAQVDGMFVQVEEALGPVAVLVNNAGIRRDGLSLRMPDAEWHEVIATNLYGTFACSRRALLPMVRSGKGRIVNIASVAGLSGSKGQANYCAAKAGVIGLTKAMALEVARRNVTVNAIAPGLIETELTRSLPEERFDAIVEAVPMQRAGTAEEVAGVVTFLCSEDANYITGSVFAMDGGMTA